MAIIKLNNYQKPALNPTFMISYKQLWEKHPKSTKIANTYDQWKYDKYKTSNTVLRWVIAYPYFIHIKAASFWVQEDIWFTSLCNAFHS